MNVMSAVREDPSRLRGRVVRCIRRGVRSFVWKSDRQGQADVNAFGVACVDAIDACNDPWSFVEANHPRAIRILTAKPKLGHPGWADGDRREGGKSSRPGHLHPLHVVLMAVRAKRAWWNPDLRTRRALRTHQPLFCKELLEGLIADPRRRHPSPSFQDRDGSGAARSTDRLGHA